VSPIDGGVVLWVKRAMGLNWQPTTISFEHLVGAQQARCRDFDP